MIESVFKPRPYQREAIADASLCQAWMWSRQTGKGFTVALKVNAHILETEARGEAEDWLILSRSLAASRQLARKIAAIGRAMCKARKVISRSVGTLEEKQFELTYPGGSRVLVMSSSPDAAVGFTGNVVIDEIDVHKQADELYANTVPVTSTQDFMLIITSTPRGRRMMHKIFTDSQKPDSPWSFRKLDIYEAVAQGCTQKPEYLRRQILDELKWRQEYLCEFIDDEICWIPWSLIVACTSDMASASMSPEARGLVDGDVYAGWDIARWNHLSVLTVGEKRGNTILTREVVCMQRMPFEQQLQRVAALQQYPRFRRLCLDMTGIGEMPYEAAQKLLGRVEGVKFSGPIKEHLANGVRRAMEDRAWLIPDDEGLHNDLHSLRRTVTGAGNYRFEGEANGSHADRFWSAAMMLEAASDVSGAVSIENVHSVETRRFFEDDGGRPDRGPWGREQLAGV